MQYALDHEDRRIFAEKGKTARCPLCFSETIAKCGDINVHHWAHKSLEECDPWWEPETEWHRSWKMLMPSEQVEVTRAGHRADIVHASGIVVELQHSSISVEEIRERERAYHRMIWLFDGRGLYRPKDIRRQSLIKRNPTRSPLEIELALEQFTNSLELRRKQDDVYTFRWKHPRKHYGYTTAPCYIDLDDDLIFALKKLYLDKPPYGGWGILKSKQIFQQWLTQGSRL